MSRPKQLKLREVLAELDISRAAFYRMCAKGKGPKYKKLPNGQLRFLQADIDVWWDSLEG